MIRYAVIIRAVINLSLFARDFFNILHISINCTNSSYEHIRIHPMTEIPLKTKVNIMASIGEEQHMRDISNQKKLKSIQTHFHLPL